MEISAFPFPQHYYNNNNTAFFFQDFEPVAFSNARKRPRCDYSLYDDVEYDSSLHELLRQLLLDSDCPQEEEEQARNVFSAPESVILGDVECKRSNRKIMDESEQYFADSGNSSNAKRARSEYGSVATTSDESTSGGSGGAQRRLWVKNRSKAWWEQVNSPDFPDEEFRKAFRMSRATFDMICEELESVVTKKDTMLRLAIPVRQRVAVCIWRLATGEALREVSKRFGLGISTCHKLVLEVCTAIRSVLMPKFLQWPDDNKMAEIKREFEFFSGIPNVGGSMYTTHIPIIAPKISVAAYFNKRHTERNQKTSYSITLQGVVDPKGIFTDICVGWPGSMTDEQVLEKSALFQRANQGALKDVWVVGNSGYPLMDWILVPYTHQNLTWTQHAFNEKVEEVQKVAKESFARLKGRWICLQKRTEMKLQDLPVVLGACCVLHNICEMMNEGLSPELRFELFDDETVAENGVRSANALHARDQIAHKLLHHNLAGTGFLY
ncbi:UNVERIFIED_CONTAM: protein ALP1-like [Sesamum latifolium]|uniref:Protein ALP1-like n=1 Tax=Sesamum latifolium TaxID=2727402 RepID=A0AAW2U431_9LAMI